jgi:lysophospholipase L1-like esterase
VTGAYNQPNPHNQAAMSSPPTITALAGAQGGIATTYTHTDPVIAYSGGYAYTANGSRQFPSTTNAASGGNIAGTGLNGVRWRATTVVNAAKVWIQVAGSSSIPYRFIVDGQYVDTTGTLSNQSSSPRYFLLDFGSKAVRTVSVEGEQNLGFLGFAVGAGDACSAPSVSGKRMIVLGDSITTGTAATRLGDGFASIVGDMLGFSDVYASGLGGTGYIATNAGTRYKLGDRLGDANAHGPWDLIVVAMGVNDMGQTGAAITSEAAADFASLRAANPAAQIMVVGAWDRLAPSAPEANYATVKAAIQAAIPSGQGFTFLDPQGVAYVNSDGTHPTTAGHATLGAWLAGAIKTALGA